MHVNLKSVIWRSSELFELDFIEKFHIEKTPGEKGDGETSPVNRAL